MSEELHGMSKQLLKLRKAKGKIEQEEALLWKRFFEIADDLEGEDQSFRYVDPELQMAMAREMHQAQPQVNVDHLGTLLTDEQWKMVTKPQRVFEMGLLEEAVARGKIEAEMVERATERKPPVHHKKFGPISKKDSEI